MSLTADDVNSPHKNREVLRSTIKIPSMPVDTNALSSLPIFFMPKAELVNDHLVFEADKDFNIALKAGFFLLKIPQNINLESTDKFVKHFYKEKNGGIDDDYRGYKHIKVPGEYKGYFDRPYDQWENFYIDSENWHEILPAKIVTNGKLMAHLGISILKSVLKKLGIPLVEWDKITGGLTAYKGHQMFAFNHFRPEKPMRGTKLHRDTGWVTVLRSTEPGLIAFISNKLYTINPEPNYFIINFGSSFEVLTEQLATPVKANIHGVVQTLKQSEQHEGRTSYAMFLDSDLNGNIYRYENGNAIRIQSMKEFALQEASRAYDNSEYL